MIIEVLLTLFLLLTLAAVLVTIICAGLDAHDRGRARVMRGTSWTSKVPTQPRCR